MRSSQRFPGAPAHQALLRAVADYYADDPRVLAVCLFGSLARGDWDDDSDLDLDVVVADGARIDAADELARLCASFANLSPGPAGAMNRAPTPTRGGKPNERAAVIVARGEDRGDVVLASLRELSVRYHPLATTSPNIVDSLLVLAGALPADTIRAAGAANRQPDDAPLDMLLAACVRYVVEVGVALRRGRPWAALDLLGRMRDLLMELYARAHGGVRPLQTFEAQADSALQARLGATLTTFDAGSIRRAFASMLDLLEGDLDAFTGGAVQLTQGQREALRAVRERHVGALGANNALLQ